MARKKNQHRRRIQEHNILGYYDGIPKLQQVVKEMRQGFLTKRYPTIDRAVIRAAKDEFGEMNRNIEENTYDFGEALHSYAFPGITEVRTLLGIKGYLKRRDRKSPIMQTLLVRDFDTNPWQIHQVQELRKDETIDSKVTIHETSSWISEHLSELQGWNTFYLERSSFVNVNFDSLDASIMSTFFSDGRLLIDTFSPYIFDSDGFVGTIHSGYPDSKKYEMYAPTFGSLRLKKALGPTLLREIMEDVGHFRDYSELIGDVAGHRIVYRTEDEVGAFIDLFDSAKKTGSSINIGNFSLEVVNIKDRYTKVKKNGYRGYRVIVRVSSSSETSKIITPHIREIQVTDLMSYYISEIDRNHPAHHINLEAERKDPKYLTPLQAEIIHKYSAIFNRIFGKATKVMDIPQYSN